jgi:hypothetical protein
MLSYREFHCIWHHINEEIALWQILTEEKNPGTRWFKYDRDYLCVNKSQFVPVIFEPPYTFAYKIKCKLENQAKKREMRLEGKGTIRLCVISVDYKRLR